MIYYLPAWPEAHPCNLWTMPAPGCTPYSWWGQADPHLPQRPWAWRNVSINLIICDHLCTGRDRVLWWQSLCSEEGSLHGEPGSGTGFWSMLSRGVCVGTQGWV